MSRSIHQLLHTLSYGDAISGEVIALQRCLRDQGAVSEIYAINVHPNYKGRARPVTDLSPEFSGEVIIHYSIGSPLNDLYRGLNRARRTLIYHNLTPARWFRGVNARIVADIERGLQELPALCAVSDRLIADSAFNAAELRALGYNAEVLPLMIDDQKWSVAHNEGIYNIVSGEDALHLVHVGRLAPNKCIEDILKVFYFLHHHIEKRSRLWLVGIDIDTELYSFALKRMAGELVLEKAVNFVGCLADAEVKSLYQAGSAYICMSEHEGFCLPVAEAMYFGMPVVAYASSAVPDTVGRGGVLVSEKRHAEIAELIYKIHTDAALRARLKSAGQERVSELALGCFSSRVSELFASGQAPVLEAGGQR